MTSSKHYSQTLFRNNASPSSLPGGRTWRGSVSRGTASGLNSPIKCAAPFVEIPAVSGFMDGWMDACMGGCMVGWMDGRVGGWMDDWIIGWVDRWTDGWMDGDIFPKNQKHYDVQSVHPCTHQCLN